VPVTQLWEWAQAIDQGTATKFIPPDIDSFHKLKTTHWKTQKNRPKSDETAGSSESSQPASLPVGLAQPFNFLVLDPESLGLQQRSSRYPQTPQRPQTRSVGIEPSPVRGFAPREYNNTGLYAYLSWLAQECADEEYLDIYDALSSQKIGLDIFKQAAGSQKESENLLKELKNDLNIKAGMATRMLKKFQKWQTDIGEIHEV
jgi:hypothetical protein